MGLFCYLTSKWSIFGTVFKPDLTEETRTQLQEEEAIASSCLILATPMITLMLLSVQASDTSLSGLDLCVANSGNNTYWS